MEISGRDPYSMVSHYKKYISEKQKGKLSKRQIEDLVDIINSGGQPNERLKNAAKRYMERFDSSQ